jgi:glutaryl-CoA dehydrogenase
MLRIVGRGLSKTCRNSSSKAALNWKDPLLFHDQLSEEERLVEESAIAFCANSLAPRVVNANRNEVFDKAIMKEMGDVGLLGPTLKGYGCAGLGYVSYGLIANAIEHVDSGYRCVSDSPHKFSNISI